jgi:hypothetical protein
MDPDLISFPSLSRHKQSQLSAINSDNEEEGQIDTNDWTSFNGIHLQKKIKSRIRANTSYLIKT